MLKDENKPDGYYDEICCPSSRKDEVAALFSEYKIIEHTANEKEYDYLEDDDIVLEIVNPYRNENLYIEFTGRFTLFFNAWHAHYSAYEYDFSEMKKDALAIVSGKYAAICFWLNDKWLGSDLLRKEISYLTDPMDLIMEMQFPEEHIQKIRSTGVVIDTEYWKPNDCWEFEIEKDCDKKPIYTFPRRYGVRYAVKDGICCGSGAQKNYDNDTAIITYVYTDPTNDDTEQQKMLIRKLEYDAKRMGAKKIFSNITIDDFNLFLSMGYTEIERIDNDIVHNLCGAVVEFDKTMMKIL